METKFQFSEKELKSLITSVSNAAMIAATEKGNIPFDPGFSLPSNIMDYMAKVLGIIREAHSLKPEQIRQEIFKEYWRTLHDTKLVKVRIKDVRDFVEYCKITHKTWPAGGALTDDNNYQFLYLD